MSDEEDPWEEFDVYSGPEKSEDEKKRERLIGIIGPICVSFFAFIVGGALTILGTRTSDLFPNGEVSEFIATFFLGGAVSVVFCLYFMFSRNRQ